MKQHRGRCGWTDYAALLRAVVDCPRTTAEIADAFGMSLTSVQRIMAFMAGQGLVCLVATRPRAGTAAEEVWGFAGPGLPIEVSRRRPNLLAFCAVLHRFMAGPCTAADAAAHAQVWHARLRPAITSLEALGLIYVEDWRKVGRKWLALYRFGIDQPSVPRPQRQAQPNTQTRERQRLMQRLERLDIDILFATAGRPWPPVKT